MSEQHKRSVELTSDLNAVLEKAVASGQFASADAVINEAMQIWKNRETAKAETIEHMRNLVQEGIDSGPGRELDFEELKAELHAEYERRKDSRRVA
jgi:antitoxin ParD1/3/4